VVSCDGAGCLPAAQAKVRDQCGICGGPCTAAVAQQYVNDGAYATLGVLNALCPCQNCKGDINATVPDGGRLQPSGLDNCGVCFGFNNASTCFALASLLPSALPFQSSNARYQFSSIGGGFTNAARTVIDGDATAVVTTFVSTGQLNNVWTPATQTAPTVTMVVSVNVTVTQQLVATQQQQLNLYLPSSDLTSIAMNGAVNAVAPLIAVTTVNTAGNVITISGINLLDMTAFGVPTCFLTYQPNTKSGLPGFVGNGGTFEYAKVAATWVAATSAYSCPFPAFNVSQQVTVNFGYSDVYNSALFLPTITGGPITVLVFAPAPVVTSVAFTDTCAGIEMTFDAPTNAPSGVVPCSTYFEVEGNVTAGTASLGAGSNCTLSFATPSVLRMYISSDFLRTLPPQLLPVPGAGITLINNVLRRRNATFSFTATGTFVLSAPATAPTPNLGIEAPTVVGLNNNLTLSIVSTQNIGGRDIVSVLYTLDEAAILDTASNPARASFLISEITAILNAASTSKLLAFTIPSTLLDEGTDYSFTISVVNFCGGTATRSFSAQVVSFAVPLVVMPPFIQQFAYQPVIMNARITDPTDEFSDGDGYTLSWSVSVLVGLTEVPISLNVPVTTSLLSLPAYFLQPNNNYVFQLTFIRASTGDDFAVSTTVSVVPVPNLFVTIGGGEVVSQPSNVPLLPLQANVLDLDVGPSLQTPSANGAQLDNLYFFQWVCLQNESPCTSAATGEILSFDSSKAITVDLSTVALPRTQLLFFVTVVKRADETVVGTAEQLVNIVAAAGTNDGTTASASVACASNGAYLSPSTSFSITCTGAAPFRVNVSSIDTLVLDGGEVIFYYPQSLSTGSVAAPSAFTVVPGGTTISFGASLVGGSNYVASFRLNTAVQAAGSALAFGVSVQSTTTGAAALSRTFTVAFRVGPTPTTGRCDSLRSGALNSVAYNTTFIYVCTNTETELDTQPVSMKLLTAVDNPIVNLITLPLPSAEMTTFLPGGSNTITLSQSDVLGNTRSRQLAAVSVVATSNAAFVASTNLALNTYETNRDANQLLKSVLVLTISPQFYSLPPLSLDQLVAALSSAFPTPDYVVIGPALAIVTNAVAESYLQQTQAAETSNGRRRATSENVTLAMVEQTLCAASESVVSMTANAQSANQCFSPSTLNLIVNMVGQLSKVIDLNNGFGNSSLTNVTACYTAAMVSACLCQQRLLVVNQAPLAASGFDIEYTCGLFINQASVQLCGGNFVATLPATGGLSSTLGATCVNLANNMFGSNTANTTLIPYVNSNLVGLTLTSSGAPVAINSTAGARFSFSVPMDSTLRTYATQNQTGIYNFLCGYLDEPSGVYVTDGCYTDAVDTANSLVSCVCTHTTTYAVLVQVIPYVPSNVDNSISTAFLTLFIILAVVLTGVLAILGFIFLRRSQKRVEGVPSVSVAEPEPAVVPTTVAVVPAIDEARLVLPVYNSPPSYAEYVAGAGGARRAPIKTEPVQRLVPAVSTPAAAAAADDDDDEYDEEEEEVEPEEEEDEDEDDADLEEDDDDDDVGEAAIGGGALATAAAAADDEAERTPAEEASRAEVLRQREEARTSRAAPPVTQDDADDDEEEDEEEEEEEAEEEEEEGEGDEQDEDEEDEA
jgi:hypothetical protein